jgi:hypothetical protein
MRLKKIKLSDKKIFQHYLSLRDHALAVYSFADIYIWKGLYSIRWAVIDESLCVFFQDKIGCFLYLPPLGKISDGSLEGVFDFMDSLNCNSGISRADNVEEGDLERFRDLGYKINEKSCDYLCLRADLAGLKGDAFKSKRASVNYFCKNYDFQYELYGPKIKNDCLKLYETWAGQRSGKQDKIYQGMIKDSLKSLKVLLADYRHLDCTGRVVKIGKRVKGFTFGFKLNPDTFCVLYEVTDLSVKGLAQFMFQKFCSELKDHRYINIMDDSGLDNLRQVKLSYRPVKQIPAYIIQR